MSVGHWVFGVLGGGFVLAAAIKAWLFFSVVQEGLRHRGVSVDDGRLALRGSFGHYTRTYLALLDADERQQPCNQWVARLQWLVPLLGFAAVFGAILAFSLTGQ